MFLGKFIKSKTIVLVKLEFQKFVGELYTMIPSFNLHLGVHKEMK